MTATALSTLAKSSSRYLCSNSKLLASFQCSFVCRQFCASSFVIAANLSPLPLIRSAASFRLLGRRRRSRESAFSCRRTRWSRADFGISRERIRRLVQVGGGLHHVMREDGVQLFQLLGQRLHAAVEFPVPPFHPLQLRLRF